LQLNTSFEDGGDDIDYSCHQHISLTVYPDMLL